MNQVDGRFAERQLQEIMKALEDCYGSLEAPNFRYVSARLEREPHAGLIASLRARGFEITDTTDPNDDVSTQAVAQRGDDCFALELSAVGPFAILRQVTPSGASVWLASAEDASTASARTMVTAVSAAGLRLIDRETAMRSIRMHRFDGNSTATLYQALFTDSDQVP